MKHAFILLVAGTILASCGNSNKQGSGFALKGSLKNAEAGTVLILEELNQAGAKAVDSTKTDDKGNFEFNSGYAPGIGFYRLRTGQDNFTMLVIDSTQQVSITADAKDINNTVKVEGSPDTKLFQEYTVLSKETQRLLDSLQQAFQSIMATQKMDSTQMEALSKTFETPYNTLMGKQNDIIAKKIKENTGSFASIIALQQLDPDKFWDVYKALDEGLSKKYPNNEHIKSLHEMVLKLSALTIGAPAPDIRLLTPDDNALALSSFKGKVVLIDFWASWCGPCRKEMPNVVKAYKKYKDKGFEIFGVSLDRNKEDWVAAIKKDGITWPQVSDLKFWQSDAAQLYGVQAIPFTVLVDRDGKILAKGLRGEELEAKLAEILH